MAVESELPLRRPSVESGVDTNGDSKVVAPQPVTDELRQKIIGEAKDIEFDCRVAARCHSRAATFWLIIHYALGLPAAVLAAVAGISAIADHPTWAAILAISSAVVAGMNTFLNPGQMTQGHSKKRSEYEHLKNDVRHFRNITLLMQGDAATLPRISCVSAKHVTR